MPHGLIDKLLTALIGFLPHQRPFGHQEHQPVNDEAQRRQREDRRERADGVELVCIVGQQESQTLTAGEEFGHHHADVECGTATSCRPPPRRAPRAGERARQYPISSRRRSSPD